MAHGRLLIAAMGAAAIFLNGCSAEPDANAGKVDASGKDAVSLTELPDGVVEAVNDARPGLVITAAEYETRNGTEYYDVGGTTPEGAEVELDLTVVDGRWTVVEIQRDVSESETPAQVRDALYSAKPGFTVVRVIESDQGDGVVIYEFYQVAPDGEREKAEVKFEAGAAEFLDEEWVH